MRSAFARGSLQRRLLVAALALTALALLGAALSIGFILERFVRGQIDGRLDDRLAALAADLGSGPGGRPVLARERDGPPFDRPRSGWYWQVRRGSEVLRSESLDGRELALPEPARPGRAEDGPRPADGRGPFDDALVLRLRVLPGTGGAPPTVLAASAPAAAIRGPVLEAFRTLALALGGVGLILVLGAFLQVRLGLRPLARLRGELAQVRAGGRERLSTEQPLEVRPLVEEMNALLDQNEAGLAHARAHVANLAHGLKTPLATLAMALAERGAPDADLARLVEGMDRRVRHHLRRARAAAVAGPARTRAALAVHAADLRVALLRLHADKGVAITVEVPSDLGVACDAQDLDELLGNLVENACQWCRREVRIGAAATARATVTVVIEDDGPGLPAGAADAMLARGRRGDETTPGHGFGLPIAMELAGLYGGSLTLGRAALGGLRVEVVLPG